MTARIAAALALAFALPLTGCIVKTRTGADGNKDVDVSTPLGGLSVKTNSSDTISKIGLPVYPGATPEKKKDDNDSSANVNLNLGFFHLSVLAAGYTTTDSPAKVDAFYRKALSQYSDVIACRGKHAIGSPTKTGLGLTCEEDDKDNVGHGRKSRPADEIELKAGSGSHQHIVGYEPEGSGTHFALINLQLPRGDDKDDK